MRDEDAKKMSGELGVVSGAGSGIPRAKVKEMKRILRVFPRWVKNATPVDDLAIVNRGPELFDFADEIHISVAFSFDLPRVEYLAKQWQFVAPVRIGGPATGERGEEFVPGMYLRKGYTITSRGCPNKCWFCSVWKRDGAVRELPIRDGWKVQDDNLLACSESHIRAVFDMLYRQRYAPEFSGGLEAKRLKRWHVDLLVKRPPKQMFFAYDTDDDYEPLVEAARLMKESGLMMTKNRTQSHRMRCFVLCGWPADTESAADKRMNRTLTAGFTPMAMLWMDQNGKQNPRWRRFQKRWARPAIVHALDNKGGDMK